MPRLLVVEDNKGVRDFLSGFLQQHGFASTCVSTLSEGRKELAAGGYELIVADASLPDGSGIDLVAEASSRGLKGLLFSGHDQSMRLLEQQNIPYLRKPFDLDEFLAAVQQLATTGAVAKGGAALRQ